MGHPRQLAMVAKIVNIVHLVDVGNIASNVYE